MYVYMPSIQDEGYVMAAILSKRDYKEDVERKKNPNLRTTFFAKRVINPYSLA